MFMYEKGGCGANRVLPAVKLALQTWKLSSMHAFTYRRRINLLPMRFLALIVLFTCLRNCRYSRPHMCSSPPTEEHTERVELPEVHIHDVSRSMISR